MEDSAVVVVSYSGKEINAKLVYYGAGLSGKTTNLESIYEAVPESSRGKMVSMKTQSDRTLFFDLLPLDLGEIMGFKTRFLLYTVPGQVFYNATRKLVLKGADAIVFVADSEVGKMEENKESLANLRANLAEYDLNLDEIPWVIQYNKRDLGNVYSMEELNRELNPKGTVPTFEAVATQGRGVFETFRGISHLLMEKVTRELRRAPGSTARSSKPGGGAQRPGFSAETLETLLPTPHRAPAPTPERTPAAPAGTMPSIAAGVPPLETMSSLSFQYGREVALPEPGATRTNMEGHAPMTAGEAAPPETTPPPSIPVPSKLVERFETSTRPGSTPGARAGAPVRETTLELSTETEATTPARPSVAGAPADLTLDGARAEAQSSGTTEMVVPVAIPRGGTRQIVLKIIISDEP